MYDLEKEKVRMLKAYQKAVREQDAEMIQSIYEFGCILLANVLAALKREDQCTVWTDIPKVINGHIPDACVQRKGND